MESLKLTGLEIIYAGDHTFSLARGVRAVPLSRIRLDVTPLG